MDLNEALGVNEKLNEDTQRVSVALVNPRTGSFWFSANLLNPGDEPEIHQWEVEVDGSTTVSSKDEVRALKKKLVGALDQLERML